MMTRRQSDIGMPSLTTTSAVRRYILRAEDGKTGAAANGELILRVVMVCSCTMCRVSGHVQ